MTQFWREISLKAVPRAAFFISIISFSMLVVSCNKHDDEIGYNLIPGTDPNAIVDESLEITAFSVREDSIRVDSLNSLIVGALNDPRFGESSVSVYTQALLQEINITYGTNPTVDSIVLSVPLKESVLAYGDPSSEIEIDVMRMDEIIDINKKYFSNYNPKLAEQIGQFKGTLRYEDSTHFVENGTKISQRGILRIPLNKTFGEEFLTAGTNFGAYGSNEAFLKFLNGIALIPKNNLTSGQGRFVGLNLTTDDAKLILYYNGGSKKEFDISKESANTMHYEIKSRSTELSAQLNTPNVGYSTTYVQSLTGCKTKLIIPELSKLANGSPILINEAVLTFTVEDGSNTDHFPAPGRLLLVQPSEATGANAFIIDLIDNLLPPSGWAGYTNYGGQYNAESKTYTFRINRHVQELVDTYLESESVVDKNRGLLLIIPSDQPITPSRLVLNTDNSGSVKNLKLKIVYTKL
ncbi:MAG: hypothetical protein ACI8ZN_001266 [Bacteroidia bacterium]|jgi:hypothetical protein